MNTIPAATINFDLSDVQRLVKKYSRFGHHFVLPEAACYIVPISSGADSTCVALVLKALYPEVHFNYVFTDTGVETRWTHEAISNIEAVTGNPVTRMIPEKDMFEVIAAQGSYLPGQRQRFCTRMFKMSPFEQYMNNIRKEIGDEAKIASFVGIRADEAHREGGKFANPNTQSFFPLVDLGFDKQAVFGLLSELQMIPPYYMDKSRSGCSVCIFSRRSEIIAQIRNDWPTVKRAAELEKLSEADQAKLNDMPVRVNAYLKDYNLDGHAGSLGYWATFAKPMEMIGEAADIWERERAFKLKNKSTVDMFGNTSKDLFVAVEFEMMDSGAFGGGLQTVSEKVITFSGSLGGLTTALKFYQEHRLATRQLRDVKTEEKLNTEYKIAVYQLQVNDFDKHVGLESSEGFYTWQNDKQPLLVVRKTLALVEHILQLEGLRQDRLYAKTKREKKGAEFAATQSIPELGKIVWAGIHEPISEEDLMDDADIEDAPVACNVCSK